MAVGQPVRFPGRDVQALTHMQDVLLTFDFQRGHARKHVEKLFSALMIMT